MQPLPEISSNIFRTGKNGHQECLRALLCGHCSRYLNLSSDIKRIYIALSALRRNCEAIANYVILPSSIAMLVQRYV